MDTWADVVKAKPGHVFHDERAYEDVRVLVMRGPSSLCAYVGVPDSHPLAGKSYDDIDLECHGGLTFSDKGGLGVWPAGWFWYGWDYAHSGDYAVYYDTLLTGRQFDHSADHKWTPAEVVTEAEAVAAALKTLADATREASTKEATWAE